MAKYKIIGSNELGILCWLPERFLDWQKDEINSLEEAMHYCDNVAGCNDNCKCNLRDHYRLLVTEDKT